ncbi:MAG TPA: flagellar basal body rod protein FlgB [bacterium]|nr:flagellar basal body rod protein FlgB [bacterium]
MLNQFFSSVQYIATRKALDAAALRQKTISNNIANVDTPHYKRSEVNFEDAFKQALEKNPRRLVGFKTDHQHFDINSHTDINSVQPTIWRQNDTFSRADDNNVDIDVEMAELAKNQLMFNALIEGLNRKMSEYKKVIKGQG